MATIDHTILTHLERVARDVCYIRERQDKQSEALAALGARVEAEDLKTRYDSLSETLSQLTERIGTMQTRMAVAQAKAGGVAGVLGGGGAVAFVEILKHLLGAAGS